MGSYAKMSDNEELKPCPCKTCGSIPEIFSSVKTKTHIVCCRHSFCEDYVSTCCFKDYVHYNSEEKAVDNWNKNKGAAKTQTAMIEKELMKNGIYADKFKHVFNMKTFDGRTLNEVIEAGEDTSPYVKHIIEEEKIRLAAYKRAGLADSKAPATNDWKATISIPRCEND